MAFNPPIPAPPKEVKPKLRPGKHSYRNKELEYVCKKEFEASAGNSIIKTEDNELYFNFYLDFLPN